MTHESDKLVALAGFAFTVQKKVGGEYFAGIWKTDFVYGLMWRNRNTIPLYKGGQLRQPSNYRAPSWSWAAVDGWIWYSTSHLRLTQEQRCTPSKVVDVHLDLVGPSHDPMGEVTGGHLKITGPLRIAKLAPAGSSDLKVAGFKNHHLLVASDDLDSSDPLTFRAVGHFDIEET